MSHEHRYTGSPAECSCGRTLEDENEEQYELFATTKERAEKAEAKLASIGELVANWSCQCCCDEDCRPCLRCRVDELVKP